MLTAAGSGAASRPIFVLKPWHCWRGWVLDLDPLRGAAGTVRRAEPLRCDALAAERARVLVNDCPVAAKVLIEGDPIVRKPQQPSKPPLAILDWLSPKVLTVHLEEVERAEDRAGICVVAADQIEHRQAIVVAHDGFPVDHTRSNGQSVDRFSGEGKPIGEVMAIAGQQSGAATPAMRQDAKAVVFNFVNPARTALAGCGRQGSNTGRDRSTCNRRRSSRVTDIGFSGPNIHAPFQFSD